MKTNPTVALRVSEATNERLAALSEDAAHTLPDYLVKTPVTEFTQTLPDGSTRTVYIKDETQQPGRSFKDRGAAYAVGEYVALGASTVLTASAGNHGLGLARAAQHYGLAATVVVPEKTEEVKKQGLADLGAELVEVAGDFSDAEQVAHTLAKQRKAQFVHPFADPYVIAGQGSVAVELLEQLPDLARVYIPTGGGGLLAGFGSVLKARKPASLVVSTQVNTANSFTRSLAAGRVVDSEHVDACFGGLAVRTLNPHTFELARRVTDTCVQVCPTEVFKAVFDYREATGVLLEPAGAVGLAAARAALAHCSPGEIVATVLTGANAALEVGEYIDELAAQHGWRSCYN